MGVCIAKSYRIDGNLRGQALPLRVIYRYHFGHDPGHTRRHLLILRGYSRILPID